MIGKGKGGVRRGEERKRGNEKSMLMERSGDGTSTIGGGTQKIGRSTTTRTSRRGDMIPILIDNVYVLV
jgi:hypothetical protein